jgi:hypothetical protein
VNRIWPRLAVCLVRQRLDLHDHSLGRTRQSGRDDLALRAIFLILAADPSRPRLMIFMSVMDEFGDRRRGQADLEFVLSLFGNADKHGLTRDALKANLNGGYRRKFAVEPRFVTFPLL